MPVMRYDKEGGQSFSFEAHNRGALWKRQRQEDMDRYAIRACSGEPWWDCQERRVAGLPGQDKGQAGNHCRKHWKNVCKFPVKWSSDYCRCKRRRRRHQHIQDLCRWGKLSLNHCFSCFKPSAVILLSTPFAQVTRAHSNYQYLLFHEFHHARLSLFLFLEN